MVGTFFNLAKVNTVACLCAAVLSLGPFSHFLTASRQLDSFAYIGSLIDAYCQYLLII